MCACVCVGEKEKEREKERERERERKSERERARARERDINARVLCPVYQTLLDLRERESVCARDVDVCVCV